MVHSVFQGQGQQGGSANEVLATKPDDWRSSPRHYMVEGENQLMMLSSDLHLRVTAMYILPY